MVDHFFSGSALCAVGVAGRIILPAFVRTTLDRCSDSRTLLIGCHERDRCLIAYDRSLLPSIHADIERRRIAEEAAAPLAHHVRARRAFGFVEEISTDAQGKAVLPPMMRRRARIGRNALMVGTGAAFEIWDAEAALETGDTDLRELASFHLDISQAA